MEIAGGKLFLIRRIGTRAFSGPGKIHRSVSAEAAAMGHLQPDSQLQGQRLKSADSGPCRNNCRALAIRQIAALPKIVK
jgi:hypothetical protein